MANEMMKFFKGQLWKLVKREILRYLLWRWSRRVKTHGVDGKAVKIREKINKVKNQLTDLLQ